MTDSDLKTLLRPLMPQVVAAAKAQLRAEVDTQATRTFSAESEDAPNFRPAFSADEVGRFGEYFSDDGAGHYPFSIHRHFGMTWRQFADAAGVLRKQVPGEGGKEKWAWVKRPEKAQAKEFAATFSAPGPPPRPGLVWKEDTHHWIRPDTGERYEHPAGHAGLPDAAAVSASPKKPLTDSGERKPGTLEGGTAADIHRVNHGGKDYVVKSAEKGGPLGGKKAAERVKAEELSSKVAAEAGVSVPAAHAVELAGKPHVVSEFVKGTPLASLKDPKAELAKLPKGEVARMVLFDFATGYSDNHLGNYLIGEDGRLHGIDRETSFGVEGDGPEEMAFHLDESKFLRAAAGTTDKNVKAYPLPREEVVRVAAAAEKMLPQLAGTAAQTARARVELLKKLAAAPSPTVGDLVALCEGKATYSDDEPATFAAPGPPPRPGLAWKDETHRWVNPQSGEEHEHAPGGAAASQVHYHGPTAPAEGWQHVATDPHGNKVWQAPAKKAGIVGRLLGKPRPAATADPTQAGHTASHTLAARMQASPACREAAKQVEARNSGGFAQIAAKSGKPVEEVKKELAAKAQALVDSQDLYVRVPEHVLPLILQGGRFKTTHETGTSGGLSNKKLRAAVEERMGVPADAPNETKPVSVYLAGKDFGTVGHEKGVADYGAVVVKLKDRVRDRATVTLGDSLQQVGNGTTLASPMKAVGAGTVNPNELLHDPKLLDSHAEYHKQKGFIEGQVHGGVSTSDVEEVAFPREPDPATQKALHAQGIKWRVYGVKTHSANFSEADEEERSATFGAEHKDGEEWETNGRKYRREGGKTVRVAKEGEEEVDVTPRAPQAREIQSRVSAAHAEKVKAYKEYREADNRFFAAWEQFSRLEAGAKTEHDHNVVLPALRERVAVLHEAVRDAVERVDAAKEKVRTAFAEGMAARVKNPAKFARSEAVVGRTDTTELDAPTPGQQKVFEAAHKFLAGICHWPQGAPPAYRTAAAKDGRAFYADDSWGIPHREPVVAVGTEYSAVAKDSGGSPYLSERDRREAVKVHCHELGHLIEYRKPGVAQKAKAFLAARTAGEAAVSLKGKFPRDGYGADEEGKKDHFDKVFGDAAAAYYVGKIYPSGATEIVSMGLQQLLDDPGHFAEADPEYFQFMVEVLTK